MNLIDPILFQCRLQPDAPALSVPGFPVVSYGRLEAMVNNVMRAAIARGLATGSTVAIWVGDARLHVVLVLAMARLGITTVTVREPKISAGLRIDALLTDTIVPVTGMGRVMLADFTWCMGDGKPVKGADSAASAEALCRIILTSGTTGDPKAIGFTNRMVWERILRHLTVFGSELPNCSRTYCNMGLGTSLGYMFLIYTLYRGGTLFLGTDAKEAADALELFSVENWVGSPAGLQEFLKIREGGKFQHQLKMMLTAGSLLSRSLAERARGSLCPQIVSVYGATETSMIATAPVDLISATPGAVGFVTPGVTVEAVNEQDEPVSPGREGLIRIRGPYNATGYLGDPVGSAKSFRNGWFYPGDFGCVTSDNLLIISGREKNIINVGGDKIRPELIEDVLASFAGIEQAAVVPVSNSFGIEEVRAVIVAGSNVDEHQLRMHCERRLLKPFVPTRFVRVRELPRNEMGKVDRQRLAEWALGQHATGRAAAG